mmetsp:Transcript_18662/g.46197  ORF Transcript_18662/g.46197 Transcript_18662/m.46197 type:complete len:734 (+) Transcript_18662:259-2460(+)|eukprot:CAMPEP_0113642948 /NCGR_PEP_ID=MMETSP0017_2-20120614/22569_1 /TAXON_ID=2856 /ORGANISM="Cylindrotheca closterium" /LENGTH=733 /DNA_ID=CAMNT_0000554411 /DNA_START=121 /DNA_END=2322 /DNA_ORIENTATION=- /assembly_acc=CAM_ASM_000147
MEQPEQKTDSKQYSSYGTVLEAAFVDPAYTWPPPEGEGKNAIELQASVNLLDDSVSVQTTDSQRERMTIPPKPVAQPPPKKKFWQCCSKANDEDMLEMHQWELQKKAALDARKDHYDLKMERAKEVRRRNRYNRVPEGILIYQLNTANQTLTLMSQPHSQTDTTTLVEEMVIASARPANGKTRRGMLLRGSDGTTVTLVACEQRTAIAWMEAIDMMLANKRRLRKTANTNESREWRKNNLSGEELDQIEGQYLNLASYSNKLIRADKKSKKSEASGIYYSIEVSKDPAEAFEQEALESIAKRRAVIKDSWDFYRMICSLLRDRRKYEEVYRKMQLDPVFPYLNSMTGLNDPGETGYVNHDKALEQKDLQKYSRMTRKEVAEDLIRHANAALPSLVEICKALAGSLGMEEVGVGPIKEMPAALRKAEKKYDGDLLKVTDYCRALVVVKDFPSLLALLELARDSFGPLIRRVKLSSLKSDCNAKTGGYRDCIINIELKEHICEIQVHLWPMWLICGVDGFRHYRHCLEYNTDSFENAYDALEGLDRKTMAELIVMAEEAVAETPLDDLEWFQEKFILDYFAEIGLFMKHGLHVWAEITLRHLIRLRTGAPDIGPEHHETMLLYGYLEQVLRSMGQNDEAEVIRKKLKAYDKMLKDEKEEAQKSMWGTLVAAPMEAYDMILDPNRKEREEEEKMRREVKASKRAWRGIRKERFAFLDVSGSGNDLSSSRDEKKTAY